MKENYEYKLSAKQDLIGKWGIVIAITLIAWLLTGAFTGNAGRETFKFVWQNGGFVKVGNQFQGVNSLFSLISFLISGPINLGIASFYIHLTSTRNAEFSDLFNGFHNFLNAFLTNFFMTLFTFLWSLLLLIPGIIAAISYSMTFYILNENPELSSLEAIKKSKELMDGHKMEFFQLALSFFGWFILSIFTMGIGFLYLVPYFNATKAHFYYSLLSIQNE